MAYLSSVNIDKAKEYAERAAQLEPTNSVARDVLKRVLGFSKGFKAGDSERF